MRKSREPSLISRADRDGKKSLPIKKQKKTKSSMILSRSYFIFIDVANCEYSRWKYSLKREI
jgi:hypothetical protein